jgi:hypothetical protein
MSSPFSLRRSTGISLLVILMLSVGALGLMDVSPAKVVLLYPGSIEWVLPSEWAVVISYLEGGILGVFLLAFFRKVSDRVAAGKENSPQKLAWKLEDARVRVQQLQDENAQLKAFTETLKHAATLQQSDLE